MWGKFARLVEFTDRIGVAVADFFHGVRDRRFSGEMRRNRLNRLTIAALSLILTVAAYFFPGDQITNSPDAIFILKYRNVEFDSRFWIRIPFLLFSAFSLFSFWKVYHNYVHVMHSRVVYWLPKYLALFAIVFSAFSFFLSFILNNYYGVLISLLMSYTFALLFTFILRSSIESRIGISKDFFLIKDATNGWVLINVLSLLGVSGLCYILYNIQFSFDNHLDSAIAQLVFLIFLILPLGVMIGGMRSSILLNKERYLDQIEKMNKIVDNNHTYMNHNSVHGALAEPEEDDFDNENVNKYTFDISALATSMRIDGCIAACIIIYLLSTSVTYSAAAFCFLAFSFIFNDVMDYLSGKDFEAHPNRPLPSGTLTLRLACVSCAFLLAAGVSISLFTLSYGEAVIFSLIFIGSIVYSYFLKRYVPLIGTMLWAAMLTIMIGYPIGLDLTVFSIIFLGIYAREILLDYRDIDADNLYSKFPSLPSMLGRYTFHGVLVLIALLAIIAAFSEKEIITFISLATLLISISVMFRFGENQKAASMISRMIQSAMIFVIFI